MTESCKMPEKPVHDIDDSLLRSIFTETKIIAIVGLSDNPNRDSNIVARYLMEKGYKIIPVNPMKQEILNEKCYPDLASIKGRVDIVDVFRNIEAVPGIVKEALEIKPGVIWLQLGLVHNDSALLAEKSGISFIQSKCIKIEHERLFE